jgi:acyl-coenzyme A synthetase/AMP-(fatty) acid ligase
MLRNKELCNKYNLSHVRSIYVGAAPLGAETAAELRKQYPKSVIRNVYGKFRLANLSGHLRPLRV